MNEYLSNITLRRYARERLSGNWPIAIGVHAIVLLTTGAVSRFFDQNTGIFISLLGAGLSGLFTIALATFNMRFYQRRQPRLEDFLDGFQLALKGIIAGIITSVFIFLWSLLLIIPGIIKAVAYSQTMYILNDHPNMEPLEAITRSKEMMEGHKGRYFIMLLGFAGWFILSIFTCGIGLFLLVPYVHQTQTAFYYDLVGEGGTVSSSINEDYIVEAVDREEKASTSDDDYFTEDRYDTSDRYDD